MQVPAYIQPHIAAIQRIDPHSHKGQNGKVLFIGGSSLFHAAARWSLDTIATMVDMVFYASVPENATLTHEAKSNFWDGVVVPRSDLESYLRESDVIVIGPGMMREQNRTQPNRHEFPKPSEKEWNEDTYAVTNYLLSTYPEKKWVVDAGALQMVEPHLLTGQMIITPHQGEFITLLQHAHLEKELGNTQDLSNTIEQQLSDIELSKGSEEENDLMEELKDKVKPIAHALGDVTILRKSTLDCVWNTQSMSVIAGGNAGMTKGGTGDTLAGLVGGLYVFTSDPFSACVVGSYVNKIAGDRLYQKVGPFFSSSDLVGEIPIVLKELLYP